MFYKVVIKCQSIIKLGSRVDLIRIKLYFIKPITVAEKQQITMLLLGPNEHKAKQQYP